jgi:hypothetical protein
VRSTSIVRVAYRVLLKPDMLPRGNTVLWKSTGQILLVYAVKTAEKRR